jgi:hypothetical protein
MWVRSQNLYVIVNCEFFFIKQCGEEEFDVIGDRDIFMGEYSTERKALDVLNMLESWITHPTEDVFYMPDDDEV